MIISQIVQLIIQNLHMSAGPHGIVAWIQPPHLGAGIAVNWHTLTVWWEAQK